MTSFGRVTLALMFAMLSVVRMLCLYNMNFLEETVGEQRVRIIQALVSVSTSALIISYFIPGVT
jgi:small neutral amino acid transporter SnatA (MarC family)